MDKARMTIRFDRHGQPVARPHEAHRPEERLPALREDDERAKDEPIAIVAYNDAGQTPGAFRARPGDADEWREDAREADELRRLRRNDSAPLNQFTSDFGAWSSPFDTEVRRLEQLIRDAAPHRPAEQRPEEPGSPPPGSLRAEYEPESGRDAEFSGETGYYTPYGPVLSEGPSIIRTSRPPASVWFKFVAAVSGAVLTGLFFGWIALSLFSGGTIPGLQDAAGTASEPTVEQGNSGSPPAPSAAGDPVTDDEAKADAPVLQDGYMLVNLSERRYRILQHGIFSTAESALTALSALESKGLSGASERREQIHVYAGLAANRQDEEALKRRLESADIEVFAKDYAVPAVERIRWMGEPTADTADFFNQGHELIELISRLTAARIDSDDPMPFESQSIRQIADKHMAWSALAASAGAGLGEEERELVEQMANAVSTAVMLIGEYSRNPSFAYLWQAQTAITQFVLLENGLLHRVRA